MEVMRLSLQHWADRLHDWLSDGGWLMPGGGRKATASSTTPRLYVTKERAEWNWAARLIVLFASIAIIVSIVIAVVV